MPKPKRKPKKEPRTSPKRPASLPKSGFSKLKLSRPMMRALAAAQYHDPSPVQGGVIPPALEGHDVIGQARTGTGKTAAFAIPILEQIAPTNEIDLPQAIVLVPTRELAVQVTDEVNKLAEGQNVSTTCLYGGQPIRAQIRQLERCPQIVVGTPGRVLDHIRRRSLNLHEVWCVVLDEADRMLDIGFRPDIERILAQCTRPDRQTLLLSATLPGPIQRLAQRYMKDPIELNFSQDNMTVEAIDQFYFTVPHAKKFRLLVTLLEREEPKQAIVFCRTKKRTDVVYHQLRRTTSSVNCIHGDMQQNARNRVMREFRAGELQILVATDVVGRGIDVSGISHIINYDIPEDCDDYVHRVGRTGRMGREGVAYTMVSPEEGLLLSNIERRIDHELEVGEIDGVDFDVSRDPRQAAPPPSDSIARRPAKRYRRAL